jgi:hypothetical protein
MAKLTAHSSQSVSGGLPPQPLPVEAEVPEDATPKRRFYFINEIVEDQLRLYIWTGCTKVILRDKIMEHASELIRQIIRKQGLYTIYPGQDESAFGDLLQTAWVQIEKTLYKFRARPHCRTCYHPDRPQDSVLYDPPNDEYGIITYDGMYERGIRKCRKCATVFTPTPVIEARQDLYGGSGTVLFRGLSKVFNMWSQIARTVILAYIKKEGRDRKNSPQYRDWVDSRPKPNGDQVSRFLTEARELCKFNDVHMSILNALERLLHEDEKPHDGIIGKLARESGQSRAAVTGFFGLIRLMSHEFTDSPINRHVDPLRSERRRVNRVEFEED